MLKMNLKDDQGIEGIEQLCEVFSGIERKVRASGRADLMLLLDRVPGLVLALENSKVREEVEAHLAESQATLHHLMAAMEQARGN